MTAQASVTIGIPFLNARRTLADAVRSVFAQTHQDWELLLIDDGSTDGSLDVVRGIADPRVRVFSDGVNRGLCARLNQIAALAEGTYLARMDADDLMHPERIERQVRFLDANPAVDVVDTATFTVDDDLTPLGIRGEQPLDADPIAVLRNGLLVHPTVMGRADWFRRNAYDAAYVRAEDRELWCRTSATTKFARLCEPLFFYRESLAGNLRNYLRTEGTVRDVLRRYGPPLVGSGRTRLLVMRSRLKALAYCFGTKLGLQGRLISKRNRPLTAAEALEARRILAAVQSIALLGPSTRGGGNGMTPHDVLHVTTVPVTLGFLAGHVAHARRKGCEVHALSSPGELLDAFGRRTGAHVHAVPMPRRITPFGDLVALGRIARAMRRIRPTIVDGHTPKEACSRCWPRRCAGCRCESTTCTGCR